MTRSALARKGKNLRIAPGYAFQLLLATLREIFDESAYDRFLSRHGLRSSTASYAEFLKEQAQRSARRPRCC